MLKKKAKAKKPSGGPSSYTEAKADLICELIAQGKSLRQITAIESMPSQSAVFGWLQKHEDFAKHYAHAHEAQAQRWADEIVEISDETPTHNVPDPDGGMSVRVDPAGIQRNRLRVDARKWIASKLLPKKYGDKIEQFISGPDGKPIEAAITVQFVRPPQGD